MTADTPVDELEGRDLDAAVADEVLRINVWPHPARHDMREGAKWKYGYNDGELKPPPTTPPGRWTPTPGAWWRRLAVEAITSASARQSPLERDAW